MSNIELNWKWLTLIGFGLFLIAVLVLNIPPFCDETYYLENVTIFKACHFNDCFFTQLKGPAGPTFAWVHFLVEPFTHLNILQSRLVNIGLFLVAVFLFNQIVVQSLPIAQKLGWLNLLIVPTSFVVAGFAITQAPTFIFLFLSIYLMNVLLKTELSIWKNIVYNILFAASFALAILGRQPYLVLGLSMGIYALQLASYNLLVAAKKIYGLALTLIPLLYIFNIWGGIQPPNTLFVQDGLRVDHLLYAFGYAGIYMLIMIPRFFIPIQSTKQVIILFSGFVILYGLNIFWGFATKTPLKNVISPLLNDTLLHHWSLFTSTLLIGFALYFAYSIIYRMYENRTDSWLVFLGLSSVLIFATCIKITHQFSALYSYQAIPFLLLFAAKYDKINFYKISVTVILMALGFVNYYYYA